MKSICAALACALSSTTAMAQVVQLPAAPASAATPIAPVATENAILRAGTPVALRLMEEITTKKKSARVGQRFLLEVAAAVEVNGVIVVPQGTPAWGEVTGVRNKGMWGKSGKLDARLLFLRINGRQIRLTGSFDDKGVTGTAGVVGAVAFVPIAGFFMTGTSAQLPKGGAVSGFIDEDVVLAFKLAGPAPMEVPVTTPPLQVALPAASPSAQPAGPTAASVPVAEQTAASDRRSSKSE